ncbi:DUF742 domain-containing protein [Pseudonocardia parietis]|uniref:DUF742 domain-containing protein n=1 Tax=Pseudonocardia parietis TaxID=570936 RepID=A0ABS4VW78_9PSEU|nr:DUF742 domain-containing protein [Pseudonocardia parietis]MBP2368195.1 hypothetical protein [Pseudonocardia parietis]
MARSEIGRTGARFGEPTPRHAPDPEHPHGPPDDAAPGPGRAADERPADQRPTDQPLAGEPPAGEDLVGVTGARFGGHSAKRTRRSRRERAAEPAARDTDPDTWDATRATAPLPAIVDDPAPGLAASTPVRPYVLTGGRTRVRTELRLETLVSARPVRGAAPVDTAEKAAVLGICSRPRSVSEVAALVGVPLGVARVLIDDLATEGRVAVHGVSSAEDGPGPALLERVLSGLRRL